MLMSSKCVRVETIQKQFHLYNIFQPLQIGFSNKIFRIHFVELNDKGRSDSKRHVTNKLVVMHFDSTQDGAKTSNNLTKR